MKKVLLLITCLFVIGFAAAQQISVEDAQVVASSYFGEKATRGSQNQLKLVYTQLSSDGSKAEDMYVFNNGNDNGFVIVAGDMRASSLIVGYCDTGSFDKDNIPSNMSWWLSEYARQIDYLRENVAEVKVARARAGIKAGSAVVKVYPLLGATAWNQYEPYNNMTPVVDGGQCVTGCIATAMAQIMYFHKWPKVGKGTHTNRYDNTLTVDFSKSKYRWDNMCDTYEEGSYTMMQGYAVAKLMYDCGIAVDMQYASDGSGAFTEDVPNAFQTYFDYSADMELKYRTNQTDWDDMIKKELEAKRPIYYSSQADEDGGHAFVCDGYQIDGGKSYFHINWGWGGIGNCYCLTSLLDCGGTYFNMNQMMLIGIKANNKTQVGNVYYNLLSETAAQVTFPADGQEYQGRVEIPTTITVEGKTYNVTKIGPSAFGNMSQLTEVIIPQSITNISEGAFYGCSALKNIVVNWTSDIPTVGQSAFDDDILSNAVLEVPIGMAEQYASLQPWMMFCKIQDNVGDVIEFGSWNSFESGSGTYTFSVLFDGSNSCDIMSRCYKSDSNKLQVVAKKWLNNASLVFTYDKGTNLCTIPAQSTYYTTQYRTSDGETKTGTVYISDVPTYYSEECTYEDYPCTYNPLTGYFRINVVYYVEDGAFGVGEEMLKMEGDQYKDYSVTISNQARLAEKDDQSATQKLTLEGGKDVSEFRYAVVTEDVLYNTSIDAYAQMMADGTVESYIKSKGYVNVITVSYPQPGKYYVIIISLDADGAYHGDFIYLDVNFVSAKEWKDIASGSYTYSLWFAKSDGSPRKVNDKVLSRNITDDTRWKIADIFNGVDFEFTWDQASDIVIFYDQKIGEEYADYGDVYVSDCNQIFPEGSEYHGADSYFNREDDTFYFNNVYYVSVGIFPDFIGVETFYVSGLATDISQAELEVRSEELGVRSYNLAGQAINDSYKGIIIKNGKKYLKK